MSPSAKPSSYLKTGLSPTDYGDNPPVADATQVIDISVNNRETEQQKYQPTQSLNTPATELESRLSEIQNQDLKYQT